MASISGNGSKGHHKFTLDVTEVSTDIAGNYSTMSYTFKISPVQSGWDWASMGSKISYSGYIGDYYFSGTIPSYNGSSTITLSSGTFNHSHNADGTKSISLSFNVTDSANKSYTCGKASASGSMALTTIPRTSNVSASTGNVTLGSTSLTLYTNRASSSFTHNLYFYLDGVERKRITGVGDNTTLTPSLNDFAPYITNGSSKTCTIYCNTYNGGTYIGQSAVNVTFNVPNNASTKPTTPTITIEEADTTMIAKGWGIYLKTKSKLRITSSSTPQYSASISSYTINANGQTKTGSVVTTDSLTTSGTNTITCVSKDSRGFSSETTSQNISVVDYSNPSITTMVASRCDSDGNIKDDGTYLKYSFVGSVSPCDNHNTALYRLGYKLRSASTYTYITLANSGYTFSQINQILSGVTFAATSTYDIVFEVTDAFGTNRINAVLETGHDIFNVNSDGNAIAFGKISERSNAIELGLDTYYKDKKLLEYEVVDTW